MNNFASFVRTSKLNDPNLIFAIFLVGFFIDSVLNFFYPIPVLVPVMMVMLPIIWLLSWNYKQSLPFAIASLVFILTAIAHNLIFGFYKKNISDLVFILVFIAIYHYYSINSISLKNNTLFIFAIMITLMFSFTFFDLDSGAWKTNKPHYEDNTENFEQLLSIAKESQRIQKDTLASKTTTSGKEKTSKTGDPRFLKDKSAPDAPLPQILKPVRPKDILEYFRTYRNGLFRLPHIAAYFFGFLLLWFCFRYTITKQPWLLVLSGILLLMMLLTNVRTVMVALVISLLIYVSFKKKLLFKIGILAVVALVFIFRNQLYAVFQDTFLSSYFSMLITFTENFSRFSRVLLWKSWLHELSNFGFLDFMTGKSFYSSVKANSRNLFFAEWFHNDFMSIFYAYGVFGLTAFIWFFIRIYCDHSWKIRSNPFVFIFYTSMVLTSFLNGYYYFHPVFLLFIFILMSNEVKTKPTIS